MITNAMQKKSETIGSSLIKRNNQVGNGSTKNYYKQLKNTKCKYETWYTSNSILLKTIPDYLIDLI